MPAGKIESREPPLRPAFIQQREKNMAGALETFKEWPKATKSYIGELQNEMKRVTWPNSKQVQSTTIVVIATVFAFALYFQVVDTIIMRTVIKFYDAMTK
jgi:preprotein translocase subunit SecE